MSGRRSRKMANAYTNSQTACRMVALLCLEGGRISTQLNYNTCEHQTISLFPMNIAIIALKRTALHLYSRLAIENNLLMTFIRNVFLVEAALFRAICAD